MTNQNGRSMRLLIVVGVVEMLVITSLFGGFFVYRAIENDASDMCKKQVNEFTDRMSPAIELYLSATRLMEKTTLEQGVLKSTDQWLVAYAQTVQADEIVKGIVPTTCATDTINAQLYVLSAITLFRQSIDEALYARSENVTTLLRDSSAAFRLANDAMKRLKHENQRLWGQVHTLVR